MQLSENITSNTSSTTPTYLANLNPHSRDLNITFRDEDHSYKIIHNNTLIVPISVTTLIHKYFQEFDADNVIDKMMKSDKWKQSKYYGKTKEEIKEEWDNNGKEASQLGTLMHADIEYFLNNDPVVSPNSKEFQFFMCFWNDFQVKYPTFKPYRTEWLVYDEDEHIAGSIDCVLSDNQNRLMILDWKRSKEIKMDNKFEKGLYPFNTYDNCNYSHYSLQLNFYRHILETKYNKTVIFLMLVILHPNQENYSCYPVNHINLNQKWIGIGKGGKQH
jgi:ATP-dependent exoDNAse (exonuclease V) beta subunit